MEIHALLSQKGLSIGDVARGTQLSVPHVSRVFNCHRTPSMDTSMRISAYLGITLDEFIRSIHFKAMAA